jgi:hypothetical protein
MIGWQGRLAGHHRLKTPYYLCFKFSMHILKNYAQRKITEIVATNAFFDYPKNEMRWDETDHIEFNAIPILHPMTSRLLKGKHYWEVQEEDIIKQRKEKFMHENWEVTHSKKVIMKQKLGESFDDVVLSPWSLWDRRLSWKRYIERKKKNPYYHATFCVIGSKEFYAREQDLGWGKNNQ